MEYSLIIIILASLGAFFMAFNNGANDIANAFASAVGSRAITVRQALFIAATLNLVGAVVLGSNVANTLLDAVVSSSAQIEVREYVLGMIATLIASGLFVLFSTLTGMPVSSTHAIVGSLAGVGIVVGGFSAVNWGVFGKVGLSWIISPFASALLAWSSIKIIRVLVYRKSKKKRILKRFIKYVPFYISITVGLLAFSTISKSSYGKSLELSFNQNLILSSITFFLTYIIARLLFWKMSKRAEKNEAGAESLFRKLQVGTSCYVAFAHGSNDVANSISPVIAIFMALKLGTIPLSSDNIVIPIWILLLGGVGMAIGIATLGHRVIATLGKRITLMTNSKGFSVDFSTATTVVLASVMGMPISSTHAATGSVIGVGLEKGHKGLNLSILAKIFSAWIITVPAAAIITIVVYSILTIFF